MLVLLLAAAWIVTEWLRATLFTGFAWNPVGVALLPTAASWLTAWIGTYGLSGVAVLAGGAVFLAFGTLFEKKAAGALVLVIGGLSVAAGALHPGPVGGEGARVRIVQPNIRQEDRWTADKEERNFYRYLRMTGAPTREPRLILWPEAAVPYDLHAGEAPRTIASAMGPRDLLLTGGIEPATPPPGVAFAEYNSLYVMDPGGRVLGRYDKAHLVPYGEYLPMRPLLSAIGLSRLAPAPATSSPAGRADARSAGFGRAGIQICYEIIFSGEVVERGNRPDFIFNPSNDAWFGAWGPPQHLAQARLRAIEEGLPVLRATPTGISAVVDAGGRVLHSLPLGTQSVIDARLPPAAALTLFARFGNLLPFAFMLLLVAAAIAVRRKTR